MTGPYEGGEIVAVLPVSDLDRAEAWYGRLGFRAIRTLPGYRILASDDLHLHLAESDHTPGMSTTAVYFYVSDAAAVHDAWNAAGVQVRQPLGVTDYGLLEFAVLDPDGNLWRIGSDAEAGRSNPADDIGAAEEPPATDPTDPADAGEAPTDGSAGTGDAAWYGVVTAGSACVGCGLDATAGGPTGVGPQLLDQVYRWRRALLDADDDAVRRRPAAGTWSALEYGAHVRDTITVITERILRTLAEERPELGWWDHEAAVEDGYVNESHVETVVDDLDHNAARLREVLAQVRSDQWERVGTRRETEEFTVELQARFVLHEVVHHLHDAQASLDQAYAQD